MVNSYGLDTGGANVSPQFGADTGSVTPGMAAPSYADGGAIPEE